MSQRVELPRVIDTGAFFDARSAEVQALQQVLSADPGQATSQHGGRQSRRRTTSYKSHRHTRRPNQKLQKLAAAAAATSNTAQQANGKPTAAEAGADAEAAAAQRPMSRAMQRRPGRLRAAAQQSCCAPPAGPNEAGAPLRKLETHLWHAKRMTMQERWGHMLPEGAPGKGHGSRHVLRQLHSGSMLHDASYWCPLQLAGSRAGLLSLLHATMEPGMPENLLSSDLQTLREHDVIVHHPGQWPRGAIGPAYAMLLPPQHDPDAAAPPPGGQASPAAPVRLWLWLHPAAYHEALAVLQHLCQPAEHADQQQQQPDAAASGGVSITPLWRLRRLELRGPSTTGLLAGLVPSITALTSPPTPAGTALACQIQDPRLASCGNGGGLKAVSKGKSSDEDTAMAEAAALPSTHAGAAALGSQQTPCRMHDILDGFTSAHPPHSESQVSSWRQQRRSAELGLGAEARPLAETEPGAAAACPALLIRRRTFGTSAAGYSLVVPAQWAALLWGSLLRRGGVAAGQREWRWVAADQGCAAFPWDFPDTSAGVAEAAAEAAAHEARRAKAIKAKQPQVVPQWERLAAPAAQQAARQRAAARGNAAAVRAADAPADEQPAAVLQLATPSAGVMSADQPADPGDMDVDGAAPSAADTQPAAAGVADVSRAVQELARPGSGAAGQCTSAAASPSLSTSWWVARSASALLQALPHTRLLQADAAEPQRREPPGAPAAAGAPAAVDQAGVPGQPPAEAAHVPLTAPLERPAAGGTAGGVCLVRVRLRMTGRGVAEPGAALCSMAADTTCGSDAGVHHPMGYVMAPAVRGASGWAGAGALCSAAALDRLWQQQQQQQPGGGRTSTLKTGQCRQPGIDVAVVHSTTGERMPAQVFLALHGRAGDASM